MPIKKRKSVPTAASEAKLDAAAREPKKLVIVAKPKTPIPEVGLIRQMGKPTPQALRRLGRVASEAGERTPDASLTVEDRVTLMRTPFDEKNPQELRYRARVRNRGTAITAMCIVCTGTRKGVSECSATQCPLWAFRFGSDPFYGKSKK